MDIKKITYEQCVDMMYNLCRNTQMIASDHEKVRQAALQLYTIAKREDEIQKQNGTEVPQEQ